MKKIYALASLLLVILFSNAQTWSLTSTVPGTGREGAVSFVINGYIYVGGGYDSTIQRNDFYQYDPGTNTWAQKANLPDRLCAPGTFTLNGKGYVVSGEDPSNVTNSVYQYDPIVDKWNTMSSFPGPGRENPVGLSVGDTGYVFGGHGGGGELNDLWAYNPNTDTWTQKASMPSSIRSSGMGFVLNGIAYMGLGEYNSSANYAPDIWGYNPATNTWTEIAQFPGHYRAGPTAFTIGKFGYVGLGGYEDNGTYIGTNDIYQYNADSNSWTPAGSFPGPPRGNSISQNVGNIIYTGTGLFDNYDNCFTDWWSYIYHVGISMTPGQTVCNGSQIILNPIVTGGIAPITYSWTSIGDTLSCYNCQNPLVTITKNDTFIISASDANNTIAADTVYYGASGAQTHIGLSLANTNISCQNPIDTTAAIVTGGISPFVFQWGDGTSGTDLSPAVHYYTDGGVFVVTVADSTGCALSAFDTIVNTNVAVSLAKVVTPICLYDSSGKIFVNVTGGTPPYTYSWTTGATADSLTNVPAGDYGVTVTDTTGCSASFVYQLNTDNDVWDYYIYLYPTSPNCTNNGSITTSVYGGTPPYSYFWSDSATTQNIQNLSAGTYNLTVTDSIGCPRKATTTLYANCASFITGYVFVDANNNCTYDSVEAVITGVSVTASANGNTYYGYTDWTGFYFIQVPDTGTYYMQTYLWGTSFCANLSFCGNPNQTVTIDTLGEISYPNNFATTLASGFDLTIHPGWTSADPGFQKEYWVMPYNQSFVPFTGQATVTFTFDPNLIYQFSLPPVPAYDPTAHTLTWVVDSVPYPSWDWYNERFQSFFMVPDTLSVGYLLQSDFYISPTAGDCDTTNNHLHFSETVIGSHDPNEKIADPVSIDPNDSVITYSIHFQNTGTDSTHFIIVVDTLSSNLEPTTVKNLASSDPYSSFTISGQGRAVLTWTFNPLALPDSLMSPAASKGFVTFSVQKKNNLPEGTAITNSATIYFDYNSGVVTNTVTTTVATATALKGVANNTNTVSVKAYPNPFDNYTQIVVDGLKDKYDFELFSVTGQLERKISSIQTNQFILNRDDLATGMYFYRISVTGKEAAYGKLVIE